MNSPRGLPLPCVLAGALLLGVPPVSAQESLAGSTTPTDATESTPGFWRTFEPHARLVGRFGAERLAGATTSDYSTENVRIGLRWDPAHWFRAEVEYDFVDATRLKDAYVRLRGGALALKLGRFKPPSSAIELESRTALPSADRGLLYDVLVGHMGWAGRRPGAELDWHVARRLNFRAGAFEASHMRGGRLGTASFDNLVNLRDTSLDTLAVAGRLSYSPGRADFGLFGEWRPADPVPGTGIRHYWAAGADFKWSDKPKNGGRRLWLDGMVGSNWQDSSAFDDDPALFVSGRVVAAWRGGGRKTAAMYVEPFLAGGILDPDTTVRADVLWDVSGGVNFGLWERVRLTVEGRYREYGRNVPPALGLLKWIGVPPLSGSAVIVQLGTYY